MNSKKVRKDGFYAGIFSKETNGKPNNFFIIIIFINEFLFFDIQEIDNDTKLNNELLDYLRKDFYGMLTEGIRNGKITTDTEKGLSYYLEDEKGIQTTIFRKGSTVELILTFNHTEYAEISLEFESFDWMISEFVKNYLVLGEKINFYKIQ